MSPFKTARDLPAPVAQVFAAISGHVAPVITPSNEPNLNRLTAEVLSTKPL